jgi:CheY-like chemotaxis protein
LHGGEVGAESAGKGKGSVFTVSIPINTSAGSDIERPELLPTAIVKGLRVLVVEDNAETRDSMALVLQHAGMEVKTAASANEALQILEHDRPDIIVSDIGMPGMDGFGLLARIRAFSDERRNIPAIAVTAYATRLDREKVLKAGFHAHVTKPAEPDELLSAVVKALPRPSAAF